MFPESVAISQSCTRKWSLFRDLIRYSRWGFRTIGLCRNKVEETGVADAADLLFEMGMSVSSLGCAGGFTGSDGRSFAHAVDDALQAIVDAAALGAPVLIVRAGGSNGHICSQLRRLFRDAMKELVPVAADHEVRLAIEPVCGPHWRKVDFTGRLECAARLIGEWPGEHVGLVADLFHASVDAGLIRQFQPLIGRIALVQLADSRLDQDGQPVRCLPGTGRTSLRSWLKLLECYNYRGPIELELHGSEFEFVSHEDLLMACREFFETPGATDSRNDGFREPGGEVPAPVRIRRQPGR